MFLGAIPCWIKKSSFFCKLSTYMQVSFIIYVCSETLMLLALQHRKLRHHFYIITLDIFALSFFFLSKHSNSKLSPKYPWNASLSHCSSAPSLPGLSAPRDTCLPGRFCCLAPSYNKRCQEDHSQRRDPAAHCLNPTTWLAAGRLPVCLGTLGASPQLQSWLCCVC